MSEEPHWTEPGAFEVSDGVHRIPLPLPMDGLRAVNVYAIETEEGLTLVDGDGRSLSPVPVSTSHWAASGW